MAEKSPIPFWLVWNEWSKEQPTDHVAKSSAEETARRLARANPGRTFYVLAPLSSFTVFTGGAEVVERFELDELPASQAESTDAQK